MALGVAREVAPVAGTALALPSVGPVASAALALAGQALVESPARASAVELSLAGSRNSKR